MTAGPLSLSRRLASLSPEKRALLDRLLKEHGLRAPAVPDAVPAAEPADDRPTPKSRVSLRGPTTQVTDFYHWVNERLDASPFASHSQFLNFGYRPGDTPGRAAVALPSHVLNRNCVNLVLELIADTPLAGREVLDIGCGRGGTVSVVNTYFRPRMVAGLDLCGPAVAFCQASQGSGATLFVQADAQALPWRDETFDVVTNVESSHTYPDLARFYGEVSRVLRPGGAFLYTDVLARARWDGGRRSLRQVGLDMEDERDVTANVLASCDEVASTHLQAFRMKSGDDEIKNFLAVPGSEAYEEMRTGRSVYGMYRFVKRA